MIFKTQKEKLIFQHYKEMLEKRMFDEFDLIGFFIFIRSAMDNTDKGKYPCIYDICDTIAHRERDRGRANSSIKNIKQNQYAAGADGKLLGANGIEEVVWEKEWTQFAQDSSIQFDPLIIQDISLCVLSLLQEVQTVDENSNYIGGLKVIKAKDLLMLSLTEGQSNSRHVGYFLVKIKTEQFSDGFIDDAVYTVRENGKLRLLTEKQVYVV